MSLDSYNLQQIGEKYHFSGILFSAVLTMRRARTAGFPHLYHIYIYISYVYPNVIPLKAYKA